MKRIMQKALGGFDRYGFETGKGVFSVLAEFGRLLEALWSPLDLGWLVGNINSLILHTNR